MTKQMLGRRLMALGAVLILCALGLTAYNHWDDRRAQRQAARMLEELKAAEPAERGAGTLTLDGAEWLGWLSIPSLELELPVQAEWSYPALKTSPCRYAGTPEAGLVIAAHNYEQHFARLNLLTAGDTVKFTDVSGTAHRYTVMQVETLAPTAVEEMTGGDWDLTLFTCTYSGQARVTVRCVKMAG